MEKITIRLFDTLLYDSLHTLAVEYSVPIGMLVNLAIKRLIDDVAFLRDLRAGKIKPE